MLIIWTKVSKLILMLFIPAVRVQVFGMAWSPDGKLLATVCKDGKVRIYDPRKSTEPVQVCMTQCAAY